LRHTKITCAVKKTPKPAASATPIAFVQAIVLAYEQRNISPDPALAAAQIAPQELCNPRARITALQMERISGQAMRELNDEALGWFSRPLPWGSYGMLARASLSAPTLGVALRRWCRHHGLLTPDIQLELRQSGELATLQLTDKRAPHPLREFCHVSVLRNIWGLACWYIDSRIPLALAQFSFPAPAHQSAYTVLFPAPTHFDCAASAIVFHTSYLSQPLRRDEKALNQMLQNALPLMVQTYRRDRLLAERTRQALQIQPHSNAEQLAEHLHVSPRTLHRQLQEHGTSLQTLKNSVRREQAIELLLRTHQPLKLVAHGAGFQNEKSFIRAFKGWTGKTPAVFRVEQAHRFFI
jgi:AraC-like DNA-binding protein